MKLPERGWIGVIAIILFPLVIEDLSGLVYADQNVLLDNLAGIGILIGVKVLWRLREALYAQHPELRSTVVKAKKVVS